LKIKEIDKNTILSPLKVLSLFDGISCGMVALERAGLAVDRYVAYEIDDNAIKVSKNNYPQIEQCGDVITADFSQYKGFDLIIGGSPCTNWSCAKNHTAKEKKERYINEGIGWELFKQYARAIEEVQPKYFLYENNYRISENIVNAITDILGVEPIMINSALVSAQNRRRLYWTNIPNVTQPEDKGLVIRDIYIPDKSLEREDLRIAQTAIKTKNYIKYDISNKGYYSQAHRLYYLDGKAPTQARCRTETKTNILLDEDTYRYKIISPVECERLQTLPDNYTAGLPKTRRFEVLGNGWTVDVIVHILRGIKCTN
jgi:DNA (cytosine-5)-methyltransferase 3A